MKWSNKSNYVSKLLNDPSELRSDVSELFIVVHSLASCLRDECLQVECLRAECIRKLPLCQSLCHRVTCYIILRCVTLYVIR